MWKIRASLLITVLLIAACGKSADNSSPLAFVPADTPFVMANAEPAPEAAVQTWTRMMQGVWPSLLGVYDRMLDDLPDPGDAEIGKVKRVTAAILDEVRDRDTQDEWAQVGFSMQARGAFYGVGLVPVLRVELADADKFRAMVARIEQKAGASLTTARVDDQDLWTIALDKAEALIAIEGKHLVITVLPANAEKSLRRRVLGLDRPGQSLESSAGLIRFNKAEGYLAYGSGWIDFQTHHRLDRQRSGLCRIRRHA
ncbi:MAG: hypothetical protein IPH99_05030 [Xanthomonadales bacterium]|nr:hypothetical protein [Xanthomonadales bacterium]